MRQLGMIDHLLSQIDTALRTLAPPKHRPSQRLSPATAVAVHPLTEQEKLHAAGLMRVNHAGEVCAQALYQGQALTAQLALVRAQMTHAAAEEIDHLAWCEQRLDELDGKPSILNPLWYLGSFLLGSFAGLAGDQWSLGFVAETERQVSAHLQSHLQNIAQQDEKTKAILQQMHDDEAQHAQTAKAAGAAELPFLVKKLMQKISKLMTKTSYYI